MSSSHYLRRKKIVFFLYRRHLCVSLAENPWKFQIAYFNHACQLLVFVIQSHFKFRRFRINFAVGFIFLVFSSLFIFFSLSASIFTVWQYIYYGIIWFYGLGFLIVIIFPWKSWSACGRAHSILCELSWRFSFSSLPTVVVAFVCLANR